ncbi:hypothetical protein [Denitromonas iodatirespirans]|uniref:DUF1269 domain-containing protein n=1 Tax=Denitromonas iodatirespirans TaxID=2795389 RepID=A0A944D8L3_DENI1|nr:hypothetical protein [Denitromonas iodatirespirans]MBT0962115.1 hypothetical protein [Denitromonas iodatirespirans]
MSTMNLMGERSKTLIVAVFDSANRAGRIAEDLRKRLEPWQVSVVQPNDPELARKIEPEQRGIFRTMKGAHLKLGVGGLMLGLLVGFALYASGAPAFASTPVMTVVAGGLFGAFAGLLLAGLLGMRPDHDVVTAKVAEAAKSDQWTVVTHPTNEEQASSIRSALKEAGGEVMRSL